MSPISFPTHLSDRILVDPNGRIPEICERNNAATIPGRGARKRFILSPRVTMVELRITGAGEPPVAPIVEKGNGPLTLSL